MPKLTSLEICAGAGGQALGLEQAGFKHIAAVENDHWACETLRQNRDNPEMPVDERWPVLELDVHDLRGDDYYGIDLFAGGVPCPPFSVAGKQLGAEDERDLFPKALELVRGARPKAVMLENVRGLSQPRFTTYRNAILKELHEMGYATEWHLIKSSDYGVPQLRPRFILVALMPSYAQDFSWPDPELTPPTVGETLYEEMASLGWLGAESWANYANTIAPTLVGGSKKHGGPDVGPSRAREAWRKLGVRGTSIAEFPPTSQDPLGHIPRLTVKMGQLLQGFPPEWEFMGGKTAAWRQVGNAFPPPVAKSFGRAIKAALQE
ncbi:DNA cytosine methyltransferase [Corynebacterium sphenisci]|uniref:DNA cytosine methyltransferase n=1 Tax=Corynebacterium sphenisci TaxID=191493 RepID=UPI000950D5FD|nr:DNA cytosine methyltransferase [Corynebacterium sphenisci]